MSASFPRCQPCGPAGLERRSICARSRQRIRRRPPQSQSCCESAIRHAALTASDRSRSPSLRGFYHYDAGAHELAPIGVPANDLDALLAEAEEAMGAPAAPQILITIAARFGRISWKYSSIAYALVLKDVGVLTQTLYLMATDTGLV